MMIITFKAVAIREDYLLLLPLFYYPEETVFVHFFAFKTQLVCSVYIVKH